MNLVSWLTIPEMVTSTHARYIESQNDLSPFEVFHSISSQYLESWCIACKFQNSSSFNRQHHLWNKCTYTRQRRSDGPRLLRHSTCYRYDYCDSLNILRSPLYLHLRLQGWYLTILLSLVLRRFLFGIDKFISVVFLQILCSQLVILKVHYGFKKIHSDPEKYTVHIYCREIGLYVCQMFDDFCI